VQAVQQLYDLQKFRLPKTVTPDPKQPDGALRG